MATTKQTTQQKTATPSKQTATKKPVDFLFGKNNYIMLGIGLVLLIFGFMLMSGGKQKPTEWNENEIYSFRRITLSTMFVLSGFAVIVVAILKKPKE